MNCTLNCTMNCSGDCTAKRTVNCTVTALLCCCCATMLVQEWRSRPTTHTKDKKAMAMVIEECIINTLMHVPGYLCRIQEGEFKYMWVGLL